MVAKQYHGVKIQELVENSTIYEKILACAMADIEGNHEEQSKGDFSGKPNTPEPRAKGIIGV